MNYAEALQSNSEYTRKSQLYALLVAKQNIEEKRRLDTFYSSSYAYQQSIWADGFKYKYRLLMCANKIGKTISSTAEFSYHVTGNYPKTWRGYKYNQPVTAWAFGVSYQQVKEVLQKFILGTLNSDNSFTGGFIHNSLIDNASVIRGNIKNCNSVQVKHASGGYSSISLRSYEQGDSNIMGQAVDFVLIDECPKNPLLYPQLVTRTADGDNGKGGRILVAFTPEMGITPLVAHFQQSKSPSDCLRTATWNDAPHLTEDRKKELLEQYPAHQREMRSKGIPTFGSGLVYPVIAENISYNHPLPVAVDRLCAIDFGFNNTAVAWLAIDRDTDIIYVYDAIKEKEQQISTIASKILSKGRWIPMVWPHDGNSKAVGAGKAMVQLYRDEGVNALDNNVTDATGGNKVEPTVMEILNRLINGKLKIASHLTVVFEELAGYHRQNGIIYKHNDHILDAIRYGVMGKRFATKEFKNMEPLQLRVARQFKSNY